MATVTPVFVETRDKLKTALRLRDAASPQIEALISGAMQKVRVEFNERLSASRVAAIVAMSSTDNPATDDEIMRVRAEQTEISWVRLLLLRAAPFLLVGAQGGSLDVWNDEALTRDSGKTSEKEKENLWTEILESLEILGGTSAEDVGVRATVIGPSTSPTRFPGSTIFTAGRC